MPSRTLENKVDDLTKLASALAQQVRTLEDQLNGSILEKADLVREVGLARTSLAVLEHQLKDVRSWKDGFGTIDQLKIDQALTQREIDELKKWQDEVSKQKDEWGKRLWALTSSIIVALVGWILGYFSRPK